MGTRIILASASPRRRELLADLGASFEVIPAGIDEDIDERDPERAAEELARRKAEAVSRAHPRAVVIGSDTVVVLDEAMLGKPSSDEGARAMLRSLRARGHTVVTGVAVAQDGSVTSAAERTAVQMRNYSDDEIAAWIATGEPFDKAGGYAIQDPVFRPVDRIEGCECTVIGLPLWALHRALLACGVEVGAPRLERCAVCPSRASANEA